MASDRGQNRYSDFVALETLLRFENCSSSHCLLSSWRRFHVFESSHPSFHRTVFFESLSVVFVASVPCLRVVASLVSSYCFLRVIVCCLRGVGSMSSSRRIPRFIVPYSSGHRCVVAASVGTLRSNDADGDENVKKTIGFISKTTALHVHHTCFVHLFPVFARLRRENA